MKGSIQMPFSGKQTFESIQGTNFVLIPWHFIGGTLIFTLVSFYFAEVLGRQVQDLFRDIQGILSISITTSFYRPSYGYVFSDSSSNIHQTTVHLDF